ncbi:MAG: hypothetical protein IJF83_10895 [Methanobrevibacter sp.]|nr:hypothetical protein [Methanobrevibacter sp.]
MTEKRFTICVDSNDLKSLWDNERTEEEPLLWLTRSDRIGGIDDVCKLLNELHDKNEQLKYALNQRTTQCDKYYEENEQLKQNCNDLETAFDICRQERGRQQEEIECLSEENEQLKQELFESEKDYLEINYADNPVRRDDKIQSLKEEFKERFGRDFE